MSELAEDVGRNVCSLCVVTACNTVEHSNDGAAERICGNSHDVRIADEAELDEALACSIVLYAAEAKENCEESSKSSSDSR